MKQEHINVDGVPAILWGEPSECLYLYVHGKMANKECAESFAHIADTRGWRTLSFDLPAHGERAEQNERCDIWNGMRDLKLVADYAKGHYKRLRLFACSLGAFFSLHSYAALPLERCLFQSPVVDMEYLIGQMMLWSDITPDRLEREGEIDTPIDILSWRYYQYVLAHPITDWPHPTRILYGSLDNLQSRAVMDAFAERFGCKLTVSEGSQHPFMEKRDEAIVAQWMMENV